VNYRTVAKKAMKQFRKFTVKRWRTPLLQPARDEARPRVRVRVEKPAVRFAESVGVEVAA
jgi:hypothetical protein